MNRRFWIAMAVGGLVGGMLVAVFGPVVRSEVSDRAARYGATVTIKHVLPTLAGVSLKGVEVRLAGMPSVKLELDEMVVGWRSPRRVQTRGGRLTARGEPRSLLAQWHRWRSESPKRLPTGDVGGKRRGIDVGGLEVRWRQDESDRRRILATGVRVVRQGTAVSLRASSLAGRFDALRLGLERPKLGVKRTKSGMRLSSLRAERLSLDLTVAGGEVKPTAVGTSKGKAPKSKTPRPKKRDGELSARGRERVAAARWAHQALIELAAQVDSSVVEGADIRVDAATASIRVGKDSVALGPGALAVTRQGGNLRVGLVPHAEGGKPKKEASKSGAAPKVPSLTFTVDVPIGIQGDKKANQRDVVAKVSGGPVSLSTLGVRDGDLGLKGVGRSSIESDARVVLRHDGSHLSLDGRGRIRRLTVVNRGLAEAPLKDMDVAWRTKATFSLDGRSVAIDDAELMVGQARVTLAGSYKRGPKGTAIDVSVSLPLITCQSLFDSIPSAMVKRLDGIRFSGTIHGKGHVRFDTARLKDSYDVDFGGERRCRVIDAPKHLDPKRFKMSFEKLIYDAEGKRQTMTFGPGTEQWVPLGSISRFMVGAVLTTEDVRFFRHDGFDKEAIINSMEQNIAAMRFVRGASTISMQLAKNLYLPRTKTLARKLQEAILTMYLEQSLTKEEMIELYFNVIEYGPMIYGVRPAARHYFRSSAGGLSLGQALYLGSILRAPSKQYFGAGGAVEKGYMTYLHRLMKLMHKIKRIDDDDLELGLRETVVFGGPPHVEPAEDPYDEADEAEGSGGGDGAEAKADGAPDSTDASPVAPRVSGVPSP